MDGDIVDKKAAEAANPKTQKENKMKNTYKKSFFYVPGYYEVVYDYRCFSDIELCRLTIEFDMDNPWSEKDYMYGCTTYDDEENMVKSICRTEGYNYAKYITSTIYYSERARKLTGQYNAWDEDDAGECECKHKKIDMSECDNYWRKEQGHLWVQRAWGDYLEEKCKKCGIKKVWDNEYETWRTQ